MHRQRRAPQAKKPSAIKLRYAVLHGCVPVLLLKISHLHVNAHEDAASWLQVGLTDSKHRFSTLMTLFVAGGSWEV